MSSNPESDIVLDAFAAELAGTIAPDGWTLVRLIAGNADRSFEARGLSGVVPFTAHLSQSEKGFWGLTPDSAVALVRDGREHLVLLRSPSSGYFLSNPVVQRLMPKFSVARKTGAIKINESVIRAQPRFRSADDLWQFLKARVIAHAT